jgi:hypothetical protein
MGRSHGGTCIEDCARSLVELSFSVVAQVAMESRKTGSEETDVTTGDVEAPWEVPRRRPLPADDRTSQSVDDDDVPFR